jgi:hypothetical protein
MLMPPLKFSTVLLMHVHLSAVLQATDHEPVWRQILQHHLNHNDPEVAQHAAAALGI